MKTEELKKRVYNIPQLTEGCTNYMDSINDMLLGDIRVVGLRKKLECRIITLNKVLSLLKNHSDTIKEQEELKKCRTCGVELSKENEFSECESCFNSSFHKK